MSTKSPPIISRWKGKIPFEDTALAVTDTGGRGTLVIYLNGLFSTQFHWNKVIAELGTTEWRHITYDERARGKSDRSADYTFEAAMRDIDAVLAGRGVSTVTPVLVAGWSYGAYLAAHWASRNPGRCLGAVLVDGAYPYDWLDDLMEKKIRTRFRRLKWIFPILRPAGLAPRMTANQQADSNIELGVISREANFGPILHGLTSPVRYIVATGSSWGSNGDGLEKCRRSIEAVVAKNRHIPVSSKVSSNHLWILKKDSPAVVAAMRELIQLSKG